MGRHSRRRTSIQRELPANMPPSTMSDWFFISENEIKAKNVAGRRVNKDRVELKAQVEAGVGTVWVPVSADDFVEVSWEDALLPDEEQRTNSMPTERNVEVGEHDGDGDGNG